MSDETPHAVYRDYELDHVVSAERPDQMKALADPLRIRVCDIVLERAMSVTELAERLDRPKGTVAYHVDVLVDAGLLKVVRTRRVRAVEERFYGRVARTIKFGHRDEASMPFVATMLDEIDIELHHTGSIGMTTLRHARIPLDRAAEYEARLSDLALEFVDEPRAGDVEFGLFIALYPTKQGGIPLDDVEGASL